MTPENPSEAQDRLQPDRLHPEPMGRAMELISALCEEQINPEQTRELELLVLSDIEIRTVYLRMMHLDAGLHHYASALGRSIQSNAEIGDDPADESSGLDETMMIKAVPAPDPVESEEFAERFQPTSVLNAASGKTDDDRRNGPYLKGGIAALLVLGLGLLTYLLISSRAQVKIARTDPKIVPASQAVDSGAAGSAAVIVVPPARDCDAGAEFQRSLGTAGFASGGRQIHRRHNPFFEERRSAAQASAWWETGCGRTVGIAI